MTLLERARRLRDDARLRRWESGPSLELARIYEHAAAIGAQGSLPLDAPSESPES